VQTVRGRAARLSNRLTRPTRPPLTTVMAGLLAFGSVPPVAFPVYPVAWMALGSPLTVAGTATALDLRPHRVPF
jgi:hypothetical protein